MRNNIQLTNEELQIIKQDFGKVSEAAFKLKDKRFGEKKREEFKKLIKIDKTDNHSYKKDGIAWFSGREYKDGNEVNFMGTPKDYIEIREDFDKTKDFLGNLLDKGRVYYGTPYWNQEYETDTAKYASWLYLHSDNETFKKNFERAVVEMLNEEFKREFKPVDYESALKKQKEVDERMSHGDTLDKYFSFLGNEALSSAKWRLNFDKDIVSDEDKKFRDYAMSELKKTERPIKLVHAASGWGGLNDLKAIIKKKYNLDDLRWSDTKGVIPKDLSLEDFLKNLTLKERAGLEDDYIEFSNKQYIHIELAPDSFKQELRDWRVKKFSEKAAREIHYPQFYRLASLIGTITLTGRHGAFRETFDLLKQKADENFYRDYMPIGFAMTSENLYRIILAALTSVQRGTELNEFWKEHLKTDSNNIIGTSRYGFFTQYKTEEEKLEQLPEFLKALENRKELFEDSNLRYWTGRSVEVHCFGRRIRDHHFNAEPFSLDLIEELIIEPEKYTFNFHRATTETNQKLTATYDIQTDKVSGDIETEDSIRYYFSYGGYPIQEKLRATSLMGRLIKDNQTKIIEAEEEDLSGLYEGVISLNNNAFPFLYNSETKELSMFDSTDDIKGWWHTGGVWEKGRYKLKNLKNKIPDSQLNSLDKFGEDIDKHIAKEKKRGVIWSEVFGLENITENLRSNIVSIIENRLIRRKDGLIE